MNWFEHFAQTKFYLLQLYPNHIKKVGSILFFDCLDTITYILLETQSKGMNKTKLVTFKKVRNKLEVESVKIWIHTVFSSSLHSIDHFDKLLEGNINQETIEEMKGYNPVDDLVVYSFWFTNNLLISGFRKECYFVHDVDHEINHREEKMRFDEMMFSFKGEYESGLQPYFFFQDRTIMVTKKKLEDFASKDKNRETNQTFNFEDGVFTSST
jgi:hypothetical protein